MVCLYLLQSRIYLPITTNFPLYFYLFVFFCEGWLFAPLLPCHLVFWLLLYCLTDRGISRLLSDCFGIIDVYDAVTTVDYFASDVSVSDFTVDRTLLNTTNTCLDMLIKCSFFCSHYCSWFLCCHICCYVYKPNGYP